MREYAAVLCAAQRYLSRYVSGGVSDDESNRCVLCAPRVVVPRGKREATAGDRAPSLGSVLSSTHRTTLVVLVVRWIGEAVAQLGVLKARRVNHDDAFGDVIDAVGGE